MTTLASPRAARLRAPSWLDGRFVVGALLVLGSVSIGSRVLAGADHTTPVLVAAHDLAPGTTVQPGDLRAASVQLRGAAGRYVSGTGSRPTGWVVTRAVAAGELLPRAALARSAPAATRLVSLPVAVHHFPAGLAHGDLVDIWATTPTRAGAAPQPPKLVAAAVAVDQVSDAGSSRLGSLAAGVVVRAPADAAEALVSAASDTVDLVRVAAAGGGS